MDIILFCLLVVLFILTYSLINQNIKKNNKKWVYLTLIVLNLLLILPLIKNKTEKFNNKQRGGYSRSKREKLLKKCGLSSKDPSVNHCFADGTHHTCCMLGEKARKGSNATGNPIGTASEKSFKMRYKKKPKGSDKTGWCTCLGSKVCSEYANTYRDGTHIRFINNPRTNEIAENVYPECEGHFRDTFGVGRHLTPGINSSKSLSGSNKGACSEKKLTKI